LTLTPGAYPETTLAEARNRRHEARKQLVQGMNPSHEKKMERVKAQTPQDSSRSSAALPAHRWAKGPAMLVGAVASGHCPRIVILANPKHAPRFSTSLSPACPRELLPKRFWRGVQEKAGKSLKATIETTRSLVRNSAGVAQFKAKGRGKRPSSIDVSGNFRPSAIATTPNMNSCRDAPIALKNSAVDNARGQTL
jgi:Arm DNA-binding domain